jgi:antitoxin component YwqK of YwqJK toxin-antitoxin module
VFDADEVFLEEKIGLSNDGINSNSDFTYMVLNDALGNSVSTDDESSVIFNVDEVFFEEKNELSNNRISSYLVGNFENADVMGDEIQEEKHDMLSFDNHLCLYDNNIVNFNCLTYFSLKRNWCFFEEEEFLSSQFILITNKLISKSSQHLVNKFKLAGITHCKYIKNIRRIKKNNEILSNMELCSTVNFNKHSYVKKIIENSGKSKDVEFQKRKHANEKWTILIYEIDSMIISESIRDNINLNLGKGVLPNYYTVYTAKFEVELCKKKTGQKWTGRDGEKFYLNGIEKKGVKIEYPNGMVKEEGILFDEKKIGRWTFYHDNGKRKSTGVYNDGIENGKWYYWYKSGQKEKIGSYNNGIKEGAWKGWYYAGNKFFQRGFANGLKHGKWSWWYDNRKIKYIRYYDEDIKVGEWKEYHNDGSILVDGIYDNGQQWNGIFKEGYYSDGKKAEEYRDYSVNNSILSEGLIIDENEKIGKWTYYHNNAS